MLVHGPWPRGRSPAWFRRLLVRCSVWHDEVRWFEPGSPFREQLAAHLGAPFTIDHFEWSGRNTARARDEAVRELAPELERFASECGNAARIVIAHSHGGNVVYRAAAGVPPSARPHGIVTMGTPFLLVGRRRALDWERGSLWTLGVLGVAAPPAVIATYAGSWHLPVNGIVGGAVALAICATAFWAGSRTWRKYEELALRGAGTPLVHGPRLLVIRAPADEAGLALSAGQVLGSIGYALWSLLAFPARASVFVAKRISGRWPLYYGLPLLLAIVVRALSVLGGHPELTRTAAWRWFGYGYLVLYLIGPMLAVVVAAGVAAATLVGAVFAFAAGVGFGPEFTVANLSVDVTAEPVPPGNFHGDIYLVPPSSIPLEVNGARHSLHAMPSVRDRIAEWIGEIR